MVMPHGWWLANCGNALLLAGWACDKHSPEGDQPFQGEHCLAGLGVTFGATAPGVVGGHRQVTERPKVSRGC